LAAEIGLSFPIKHHIRSEQERRPFHELAARYAVPNEANWPIARAYLVETRGIDPAIVDDLHAVGTEEEEVAAEEISRARNRELARLAIEADAEALLPEADIALPDPDLNLPNPDLPPGF
jgi:hypothetical protein